MLRLLGGIIVGIVGLTACGIAGMAISGFSEFLSVIFLGVVTCAPVVSYARSVYDGTERNTRWHSRRVTLKGCILLVLATYLLALNVAFIATYEASVDISSLTSVAKAACTHHPGH